MKKISEHPLPIVIGVIASIVGLLYTIFVFFSGRSSISPTKNGDSVISPKTDSVSKIDSGEKYPEKKFDLTTLKTSAIFFDDNYCEALHKIAQSSKAKFVDIVDLYAMRPNVRYSNNATIYKSNFFKISSWLSKSGTPVINFFSNSYDTIHIRNNLEKIKACLGIKPILEKNAFTLFRFVGKAGLQDDLDCCMCIWTYWYPFDKVSKFQILVMTWNDYKKGYYYAPSRF